MSNRLPRTASRAADAVNQDAGAGSAAMPAPTPMPVPEGGWPPDQYTGKYGKYVRDPCTGIRRPADTSAPAADSDTPANGQ